VHLDDAASGTTDGTGTGSGSGTTHGSGTADGTGTIAGVDEQLAGLVMTAMEDASPLMRSVNDVLAADPRRFVNSVAGLHLLRASVVLHTRSAEVAGLIERHGVDAVADAFIRQFERPIIETAQREAFADLSTDAARGAFANWAHQLWDTIENQPQLAEDPDALADHVFHHDKGYNRATNFAQQVALAAIMGTPPLSDAISRRPVQGGDHAAWVYQVFSDAGLIAADGTDTATRFTELVSHHRADLEPALGPLNDQRIAHLRQELVDMVMLDDDIPEQTDPVGDTLRHIANDVLARPAPPPTTHNGLYAAIAHITRGDAATLRKHVVNRAANDPNVARAAGDFTATRPMLPGHLNGALVENLNWGLRPDQDENRSAGNARDLLGHLIASHLNVNVVIHQGDGPPLVLAPLGGHSQSSVEVDLVVVNGQATYRPHRS
jgi:hypothetical protein